MFFYSLLSRRTPNQTAESVIAAVQRVQRVDLETETQPRNSPADRRGFATRGSRSENTTTAFSSGEHRALGTPGKPGLGNELLLFAPGRGSHTPRALGRRDRAETLLKWDLPESFDAGGSLRAWMPSREATDSGIELHPPVEGAV